MNRETQITPWHAVHAVPAPRARGAKRRPLSALPPTQTQLEGCVRPLGGRMSARELDPDDPASHLEYLIDNSTTLVCWGCFAILGPHDCNTSHPPPPSWRSSPPCAHATPKGPTFPLEGRSLPYLASVLIEIASLRPQCAKLGTSRGSQPKFSPQVVARAPL